MLRRVLGRQTPDPDLVPPLEAGPIERSEIEGERELSTQAMPFDRRRFVTAFPNSKHSYGLMGGSRSSFPRIEDP